MKYGSIELKERQESLIRDLKLVRPLSEAPPQWMTARVTVRRITSIFGN